MNWWRSWKPCPPPRWHCPMTRWKELDAEDPLPGANPPAIAERSAHLEIAAVFSGNHNDPESWWDWADKDKQEDRIKRFKRKFAPARPTRPTRSRFWSS